uniref:Uncharacterized protein n=1 Tax=Anguilla anguilla TaxID=7936 RepID=A0A0E9Q8N2_ANGAN
MNIIMTVSDFLSSEWRLTGGIDCCCLCVTHSGSDILYCTCARKGRICTFVP